MQRRAKMSPEKNTGAYIPDDFDHDIATGYNVKGRGYKPAMVMPEGPGGY